MLQSLFANSTNEPPALVAGRHRHLGFQEPRWRLPALPDPRAETTVSRQNGPSSS